jgi:hypothetical protein
MMPWLVMIAMPGLLQIRAVVEHSGVFGKVDLTTGTF